MKEGVAGLFGKGGQVATGRQTGMGQPEGQTRTVGQ